MNDTQEKQKILIVEDDIDIAESLALFYRHHDFETLHVDDGAHVIQAVSTYQPNLIVLDVMLPNKTGIECCEEIRQFSNVPIIMLTAKVNQSDKNIGLSTGADDYLCKPFDTMELILRSKSILARSQGTVSFSKLTVVPEKGKVIYQDKKVELSTLEASLFSLLHNKPERIYSRDEILNLAYPQDRHITDRTIDSHVKKIRNKFKEAGITENPIESVYGAGYRFYLR
ncbi:response regulator transcription factor [Shewanella sp. Scap07]|uniref:response regulator transcription factor n=1 Tax=Shewanella sp. Scap07 TaxID=2589987 RepID=UPI0015BDFC39|nr:response regulator transcription factor [Shewanella sp. Scap07]QLE86631.1 response regulator transcription factor [Shewanella sp. Scap07]